MPFIDKIKTIVLRNDLFAASATLRIKGQPKYQTICGGIASLILIVVFIAIFASAFFDVLTRKEIRTQSQIFYDLTLNKSINNFMFAVGMQEIDFTSGQQYFDVTIQLYSLKLKQKYPNMTQKISLQPCSLQKWTAIDKSLEDTFQTFELGKMLCPKNPQKLKVAGFKGGKEQEYFKIGIHFCQGLSPIGLPCQSVVDTQNFITQWTQYFPYVELKILFLDSIISQQNKQAPIIRYVNTDFIAFFASSVGTIGTISIGQYQIKTDQSILPLIQEVVLSGNYVQQSKSRTTQFTLDSNGFITDEFVQVFVRRSPKMLQIQRNYRKIDDMLSYIGGLFGLIITILTIFIEEYAEYCYQLLVAQNSFDVDYDTTQNQFNFLTYCAYRFYELLLYFQIHPNWTKMKKIEYVRQQLAELLDVRVISKKLFFYQRATDILLDEREKLALYFSRLPTIQQHSKMRQNFQSSQGLIQQFSKLRLEEKMSLQSEKNTKSIFSKIIPAVQSRENIQEDIRQYNMRQENIEMQQTSPEKNQNKDSNIPHDLSLFVFQLANSIDRHKSEEKAMKLLQLLPEYIKNPKISRNQSKSQIQIDSQIESPAKSKIKGIKLPPLSGQFNIGQAFQIQQIRIDQEQLK